MDDSQRKPPWQWIPGESPPLLKNSIFYRLYKKGTEKFATKCTIIDYVQINDEKYKYKNINETIINLSYYVDNSLNDIHYATMHTHISTQKWYETDENFNETQKTFNIYIPDWDCLKNCEIRKQQFENDFSQHVLRGDILKCINMNILKQND